MSMPIWIGAAIFAVVFILFALPYALVPLMEKATTKMCTCHHHTLRDDLIRSYIVDSDGTVWALYRPCRLHGVEPIEVVYVPDSRTATVEAVAA